MCSARPSLVLRLGGLRTDHWVVDRNVTRYLLNPGAPPSALRNNSAGDVIYFNPGHVHQDILMVNGARHDAIYTWVAHQGGGWLAGTLSHCVGDAHMFLLFTHTPQFFRCPSNTAPQCARKCALSSAAYASSVRAAA